MKRLLFPVICFILMSGMVLAQDFPRVEIFGGYNLHRHGINEFDNLTASDIEDIIDDPFITVTDFSTNRFLKKGFMASATFNMNSVLGIEAAFKYNKDDIVKMGLVVDDVTADGSVKLADYSLLAGPRFALRKSKAVTPFAHALFGLDVVDITAGAAALGSDAEMDVETDSGFGMALGGGIDIRVADFMAIRAIQADYYLTSHLSENLNNLDLSFGAVFYLGGNK